MGTNFYKIIPVSKRIKEELKRRIDEEKFTIDKWGDVNIEELGELELKPNEIHIGKRAAGWKFLFDFNNWEYFEKSEESLLNWLKDNSDGSFIKDEYGDIYTYDEFMEEVNITYDKPWINGEERWDGATYNAKHATEYSPLQEMYIGKYRVSLFTDFS